MKLGPKEQRLYLILTTDPRPHSKDEIITEIWGEWSEATDNSVAELVKRLRRKLGDGAIKSVRGYGYVYLPDEE